MCRCIDCVHCTNYGKEYSMPATRTASIFCKNLLPLFLLMLVMAGIGLAQPAYSTHAEAIHSVASGHPHPLKTKQYHASHTADVLPLAYHNGPVMRATSTSYAIFWLPSTLQDGSATRVSATYVSLIKRYFGDIGGSGLYNTATQYFDTGGSIVNSSTLGGAWIDTSPYPA